VVNGKSGDDPVRDVAERGVPRYTDAIDQLIRELWPVCGPREREELRSILPDPHDPDGPALEEAQIRLEEFRSRRLGEARERGWEGPPAT
jgi:hypothetical protein